MRFLNYKIYYFRFPLKAYRLLGLRKYLRFVAGEREPIQKALKYHFFFPVHRHFPNAFETMQCTMFALYRPNRIHPKPTYLRNRRLVTDFFREPRKSQLFSLSSLPFCIRRGLKPAVVAIALVNYCFCRLLDVLWRSNVFSNFFFILT